jgi:DNA-binding MarR family transcriptional regulator
MDHNDDSRGEKASSDARNKTSSDKTARYDFRILQSVRKIIRAVDTYSKKLADEHDITAPQLVCLLAIVEEETTTTKELAQRIHLSPSTVVGILDRLEKKGLVKRLRDTVDRRVVNVMATSEGRELAEHAPSPLQDSLADSLERLPEAEQATIALSLERVVDLMEAGDIDAAPILETGPINHSADEKKSLAKKNREDLPDS